MTGETPANGLWSLVVINSAVFILFAYSFFKPRTSRDWRSFSAFSAFLVAAKFTISARSRTGWTPAARSITRSSQGCDTASFMRGRHLHAPAATFPISMVKPNCDRESFRSENGS